MIESQCKQLLYLVWILAGSLIFSACSTAQEVPENPVYAATIERLGLDFQTVNFQSREEVGDSGELWFPFDGGPIGSFTVLTNVSASKLDMVRPLDGKANGTAIIVCPGGGFQLLAWEHEGMEVARWLAERGVTAFVLRYRVQMSENIGQNANATPEADSFEARLQLAEPKLRIAREDALAAIEYIRSNAEELGVSPNKVGIMGFSAGAITTMSVVLHGEGISRPDFAVPVYGAMEKVAVPTDLPPLYIVHAQDDPLVPAEQSTKIFDAWQEAQGKAEVHIYSNGGHGFGIRTSGAQTDHWTQAFEHWMSANGWMDNSLEGTHN